MRSKESLLQGLFSFFFAEFTSSFMKEKHYHFKEEFIWQKKFLKQEKE